MPNGRKTRKRITSVVGGVRVGAIDDVSFSARGRRNSFSYLKPQVVRTDLTPAVSLRKEGQVAWLETPKQLGASSTASLYRMQGRGFLLQQIYDREQIETVEHSPAGGEEVRQQLRLPAQEATKLSQDARFASAHALLRNL